ncbi:2-amino-4-hydroxy-6-hydroxymethyldihydropteridine diphosphokinase [Thermaurantiacus sp.]
MADKASSRGGWHKAGPAAILAQRGVRVAIGLGSNRCHGRHGRPQTVLRAAAAALANNGVAELRLSKIRETAPLGPSQRRFANAVVIGRWQGNAEELLALLKGIERAFGRRTARRWGPRVLDLDLLAFTDAVIARRGLTVPHPGLPQRAFVLQPFADLWPCWRHPALNLSVRALLARLGKSRAIDRPDPCP